MKQCHGIVGSGCLNSWMIEDRLSIHVKPENKTEYRPQHIARLNLHRLRVLFLGLVLLSAGCWGLVNGTIAGKHRKWYSGSLPNPLAIGAPVIIDTVFFHISHSFLIMAFVGQSARFTSFFFPANGEIPQQDQIPLFLQSEHSLWRPTMIEIGALHWTNFFLVYHI